MRFSAQILEMAATEILRHIPANIYEEIKTRDSHPIFRAYVVGHEGISEGKVVGHGNIVKRWFASAIDKIHEKLQFGTKVFHEHAKTNEHSGRKSIGEIVGKAKEIIDDKLSAIAIMYIKPEFKDLPLDVASMEADVRLNGDRNSGVYDADVENITAVALGNRAVNRPGFKDASLLSQIQAFADQSQFQQGGGDMITISEVRGFIKAGNLKPSDIFGLGDLTKDPMIVEHVEEKEKKAKTGEYEHRKRDEAGFDKTKETLIKEHEAAIKEKDEKIATLGSGIIKSNTPGWLETQKEKRELNDEQMKFINLNLEDFKPEEPEKAEDEFNKFLDGQVDKLNAINKNVFGKEPEKKEKTAGSESEEKKDGDDMVNDMSLED